jgi:hypothetical protein
MPDVKFSQLTAITAAQPADYIPIVDVSNQFMSENGSNAIITVGDLTSSFFDGLGDGSISISKLEANPTFTGNVILPSTTTIGSVNSTEIGFLSGLRNNVQYQLDNLDNPYFNNGTVILGPGMASSAPLKISPGTNTTTLTSGNIEFDGTKLYVTNSTPTRQALATESFVTVAIEAVLAAGKTIYVDTNGTDTRGSLSQYSISVPFATIGAAMAESVIGDTVRVRAGSYQITSTIDLNGRGNLHLEEGAVVTCSVSGVSPVFGLGANESKSISGGGQFIITGSTNTFWQQSGGGLQTQLCSFECATINTTTSPANAATIFRVSSGVLVVNAETVFALASTIIECDGTSSNLHYAVKFTYCFQFAFFPTSESSAQMSCDCWTIACHGPTCFYIVGGTVAAKYETLIDNTPTAIGCTFFSLQYGNDSTANSLVIRGGRAVTYSGKPCIRFTTTTGTNKSVRLIGDPFFYTNGPNSIVAASARSVLCSFASSNKAVDSSFVAIVGGTYAVNAGFTS